MLSSPSTDPCSGKKEKNGPAISFLNNSHLTIPRFHPHFKNVMQSRISQMMGINYKFDLLLSEDGSGRGAALVAAVLKRGEGQ